MTQPIVTGLSSIILLASSLTLLSCATPNNTAPERIDLPPPELLQTPQTVPSAKAVNTQQAAPPTSEPETPVSKDSAVLPGLNNERNDAANLPFEQSLREREKRVYLGLDREQSSQPVNNILDWEF